MKSKRAVVCLWTVSLAVSVTGFGCSAEPAPSPECSLPEAPRFDFTEVDLDEARSNAGCPEIAPDSLDTDALAEQGLCEQAIVDCVIELTCDYEGLAIHGRIAESDGALVGRFDIESPVTCLYSVKAEWKVSDGG